MFSTLQSVKEYTGVDLAAFYGSANKRTETVIDRALDYDEEVTLEKLQNYDPAFEALAAVKRAQSIIEIFIGKDETEIRSASDLLILDKMTAYQAVYMAKDSDNIFEKIATTSQGQQDFVINFDTNMYSPFIAPFAFMASKNLSWKKAKSIKTGKIFQFPKITKWRNV